MLQHRPVLLLVASAAIGLSLLARAGTLTPPTGPVAPTMKTLADLSAEHAAIQAALGGAGGGGSIKRVVRGTVSFASGVHTGTATFSPSINPERCIVAVESAVYLSSLSPPTGILAARTSVCVTSLTATQMTLQIDEVGGMNRQVSYQIVEYY